MKTNKAAGPDGIYPEMIKMLSAQSQEFLLQIFNHSWQTEDELTILTQDIINGFDKKLKTTAVAFVFAKAFDKVWREGVLFKLSNKGIPNT